MRRKAEATDAALVTPEIEALADAVRGGVEPESVERALGAFREAASAAEGVAPRRGRRRDDWRPARRRFPALVSLRTALGAALATATLGGLALAAVPDALPDPLRPADDPAESPASRPGVDAPRTPGATPEATGRSTPSPAPSASASAHDPVPRSQAALCHAWNSGNDKQRGEAFQQLVDAAGGEGAVDGYCATLSGGDEDVPSAPKKPAGTAAPGQSKNPPAASPSRGRSAEHAQGTGRRAS
ncbi:hypothetical protein ACIBBB_04810 [Streptomyces sp. NPDC051217]|uniref:hypothetical protein n=1 Tax=Streptomyces sp. NPDC051217 TaxID=3365644 RepID=UPI0037B24D63